MTPQEPNIWKIVNALRGEASAGGALAGLKPPEREARLFAYVLERMPIGLEPGETLAGDFGSRFVEPERRSAFLEKITSLEKPRSPVNPTPAQLLFERFHCNAGYTLAHTCADYERVIGQGLDGILAEVKSAQAQADGERLETLRAMEIALEAVPRWAGRYAVLAPQLAGREPEAKDRAHLLRIAEACERVPRLPARSFHEALQAIWFVHAAIGISELCDASLSLGRLDQFLYSLFLHGLEQGVRGDEMEHSLRDL